MGGYNLSVKATEATRLSIQDAKLVILKNDGSENVYFEFNSDAAIGTAYVAAGESLSFDFAANGVDDINAISLKSATVVNAVRLWVFS